MSGRSWFITGVTSGSVSEPPLSHFTRPFFPDAAGSWPRRAKFWAP
ncbi:MULTISPECIES: hypothetical protein [Streptomyces]|nr:hypothetical protein [Streptomyces sp. SID2888]MYV48941.1 hypothetical protein [Streptomyces sp. SID2888]